MNLWQRVWNLLAFGSVSVVNDAGPVQTAQIRIGPDEIRDGAPVVQLFGLSAVAPIGSDAVVLFPSGDRALGVVIGTNHQGSRPTGQASGETTLFNALGMSVYLSKGGIVVNGGGQPMTIENAPTITINASAEIIANTPRLKCSGDIIDNYGTNAHTMAAMRTIYNEHTHPVPDVQSGGSTVTTNVPTQQE